jgi:hypothetical protein
MNWYKIAQSNSFEDMFPQFVDKSQMDRAETLSGLGGEERTLIGEEEKLEDYTITLYRNFDAKMDQIEKDDSGNLIFSPAKCEGGVLWFAHNLQRDAEEYYKERGGEYLLTYPLEAKYHYTEQSYSDGSTWKENIGEGNKPYDDNEWQGRILPDGFKFSYKVQKHIICEKTLIVPPAYVSKMSNGLE